MQHRHSFLYFFMLDIIRLLWYFNNTFFLFFAKYRPLKTLLF